MRVIEVSECSCVMTYFMRVNPHITVEQAGYWRMQGLIYLPRLSQWVSVKCQSPQVKTHRWMNVSFQRERETSNPEGIQGV